MAPKDPFDEILKALGLYQQIQDLNPILVAPIPPSRNNTHEVPVVSNSRVLFQIYPPYKFSKLSS
jgi:hypothetical protein